MCDLNFQPNKIHYQPNNYTTLKIVWSTIRIFNQPHSTLSVSILYCSLAMGSHKVFLKAFSMYVHVSTLLCIMIYTYYTYNDHMTNDIHLLHNSKQ